MSLKKTLKKGRGRIRPSPAALRRPEQLSTRKSCGPQGLYYDRYRLSAGEWFRYAAAGAGIAAAVSYVFYRSLPVFIMLSPFGLCYPLIKKADLKDQRLKQLNLEFKEGILILSSFLSAGYSVENAFSASIRELAVMYGASGMMVLEFSHMEGQIRMNRPVEQVLMEFGDRSGLDDVRNFAEVFAAAKGSGGELVSIINHTSGVIRDKIQIQEEIATMTAAKQFEQKIMNLIPFFLVLYVDVSSPGFFDMMYQTGAGRWIMTGCLAIYAAAYVLAGRILRIEV
mgnify:FL=1